MSNQKGTERSNTNNSESDGELSNTEENDFTQNPPQISEISQSNWQDNMDEDDHSDTNLSPNDNGFYEIEELSSEESSQMNHSDAVESVKILYEFPDDSEKCEESQSIPQNQKRRKDAKNVHFQKKMKNDNSNNKRNKSKEKEKPKINGQPSTSENSKNDNGNSDYNDNESNKANNMDNGSSSETFDNNRLIAKPARRLSKGKDSKKPTQIETYDKTNAFKRVIVATSTSEGALADVEDNVDSQSNDDISDDHEKKAQEQIPNKRNANSTKLVEDQKGTRSSSQSVDIDKASASQNQTKTDNTTFRVVSQSNTSSQPAGGKDGEATTSSTTNQLKLRSDVGRRKKRKCFVCNKKLGLTAFTCRCGGLYCSQHRYDKEHDCNFDYKSMGAEEIRKNNPLIVAEKISKL
ncbi:protein starmaker-like [Argiope bruennichi]|uniref:protein starmaker-like n=1 Tax=Argiope bruennichi TaxID=94029 RepID=UPI002494AB07|nr:protein starmaker-like [Argiope bruennichi]